MKFFKCAAYVLFFLSIGNLAFNLYMFRELKKPNVITVPNPEAKMMYEYSTIRDSQLMQSILMIHHDLGIHKPGSQEMCPICEAIKRSPSMVVER